MAVTLTLLHLHGHHHQDSAFLISMLYYHITQVPLNKIVKVSHGYCLNAMAALTDADCNTGILILELLSLKVLIVVRK